ncbi:MAG: TIR domain-containing protein [Acidobacteriia bacterium]|nr:TIR domain-containing protein [Terriglobia bacterium]
MRSPTASSEQSVTFISYAREDKDFVLRLAEALQLKGIEIRGDWQLVRGENYQDQLRDLQLSTDSVIFVISADSVGSGPCRAELDRAAEQKKRILPVVCRDLGPQESDLPEAIRLPQWTHLRPEDDFVAGVQGLVEAISTDFDLMPEHRRLLQSAENWDRHQRSSSYLLRKDGLKRAEDWLAKTNLDPNKLPKPTRLQLDYISASRTARTRGARITVVVVSVIAVAMAGLAVVALIQRGIAKREATEAVKQKGIAEGQTKEADLARQGEEKQRKNAEVAAQEATTQRNEAVRQRDEAERERRIAEQRRRITVLRQIAAQSMLVGEQRPDLSQVSLLLAAEAANRMMREKIRTFEVDDALRRVLDRTPKTIARLQQWGSIRHAVLRDDGRQIATAMQEPFVVLWDALSGAETARLPHVAEITVMVFSRDNRHLLTGSRDGKVRLWSADTGALEKVLPHGGTITSLDVDTEFVVSGSDNGTARLWRVTSDELLREVRHSAAVLGVALNPAHGFSPSPDVLVFATGGQDGAALLWGQYNGAPARLQHDGPVLQLKFLSPPAWGRDRLLLATHVLHEGTVAYDSEEGTTGVTVPGGRQLHLWDLSSRQPIPLEEPIGGPGSGSSVSTIRMTVSADGRWLASNSVYHDIVVWSADTGKREIQYDVRADAASLGFHPSNRWLAIGFPNGNIDLWDLKTRQLFTRVLHSGSVDVLTFSSDGHWMMTGTVGGATILWSLGEEKARTPEQIPKPLSFTPTEIIGQDWRTRYRFDLSTGLTRTETIETKEPPFQAHIFNEKTIVVTREPKREVIGRWDHTEPIGRATATENGRYVIVDSETRQGDWLTVYDVPSGHVAARTLCGEHCSAEISPDGRWIATLTDVDEVEVFQAATGRMIGKESGSDVTNHAFSPDSRWLVISRKSGDTSVWGLSPWTRLPQTYKGKVALSPDSHLLAGVTQEVLEIRDLTKNVRLASLFAEGASDAIVFSPDGRLLANRGVGSQLVSVWEVSTRSEVARIRISGEGDLQFSPDARFLASTRRDDTRVWLLEPADLVTEACARATRNLTKEEWAQYVGDEPYRATCVAARAPDEKPVVARPFE